MEYIALKDLAQITMGQSPESSSYNEDRDGLPFYQGNADFGELYLNERVWSHATVSEHIFNILDSGELDETSVGFSDKSSGGRKPSGI